MPSKELRIRLTLLVLAVATIGCFFDRGMHIALSLIFSRWQASVLTLPALWFVSFVCVSIFANADDVSNANVFVAEASVSTPEDVCNRIKKNLTGFEKDTFHPRFSCQRDNARPLSVLLRI